VGCLCKETGGRGGGVPEVWGGRRSEGRVGGVGVGWGSGEGKGVAPSYMCTKKAHNITQEGKTKKNHTTEKGNRGKTRERIHCTKCVKGGGAKARSGGVRSLAQTGGNGGGNLQKRKKAKKRGGSSSGTMNNPGVTLDSAKVATKVAEEDD